MTKNLGIRGDLDVLAELLQWEGKQVLDVGCGPGQLARGLASLGAEVHGFEPDPIQAEKNREAPATEKVTFHEASAEDLPVTSASVDVVLLSRSLHHVPAGRMDQALAEARRVLKADGVLVVIEPDIHGQWSQLIRPFHDETECRGQALEALERAGEQFGGVDEFWFTIEASFPSFTAFRDRMVGMSFNEIVPQRIEQPEVHAAFEAGRVEDGFRFTNPMRVRILRDPSA